MIERLTELGVLESRGPRIAFRTRDVAGEFVKTKLLNTKPSEGSPKWVAEPGGLTRLFNEEILEDVTAMAADDFHGLVITEGELDALSAMGCTEYVVSLQNGAITSHDHEGMVQFTSREAELSQVRWFILALDNDEKGTLCREILLGYFGKGRCKIVEYPAGCKDLNDVAQKHGSDAACAVVKAAKPYPLEGIFNIDDIPEPPQLTFFDNGIPGFEKALMPFRGALVTIAGVASHGKSTLVNALVGDWVRRHRLKVCMASFEMPIKPFLRDALARYYYAHHTNPTTPEQLRAMWAMPAEGRALTESWLRKNFTFLKRSDGDLPSVDWLIERAEEAMARYGFDVLVVDPWNKLDLGEGANDLKLERRALNRFKQFAEQHNCIVVIVTHPSTIVRDPRGGIRTPGMLDIAGGAHWANMSDFIAVAHRRDMKKPLVDIHVHKAKFFKSGEIGTYHVEYVRPREYFIAAQAPTAEGEAS